MEQHAFDAITRNVAAGASRRRLVALGLGAVPAMLYGRSIGHSQSAADALQTCIQDTDCVAPDAERCTGTRCDGGRCVFSIVSCALGYSCCGNGACCPSADGASAGALGDQANLGTDPLDPKSFPIED